MKINLIDKNIIDLRFDSLKEQSLTLFRISEYYESPYDNIRGEYFSTEQFLEYYVDENGILDYFNGWSAFNIPGYSINEFFNHFIDITKREKDIRNIVKNFNEDYYLISSIEGNEEDFNHELCHAKYYLNKVYQQEVKQIIDNFPVEIYNQFLCSLTSMGYQNSKKIIVDEINAYLSTSKKKYIKEEFISDYDSIKSYRKELKKKFNKIKKSININTLI